MAHIDDYNASLVQLTGSPKQIAWAAKIRDDLISQLVVWWQGKDNAFRAKAEEGHKLNIATLKAIPDAGWFIDNRSNGHNDLIIAIRAQAVKMGMLSA